MVKRMVRVTQVLLGFVTAAVLLTQPFTVKASESTDDFGDYVVTIYNEQNGLPTGEANVVMQTSDGYIWIGSYGGLIRYDGTRFRNFSEEKEGITSSSVRSLFEDSKGRLWIGTNDAGVFVYENGQFTKIEGSEDHTFLCIRDFAEGKDGTIYAASNSGLAVIRDGLLVPIADDALTGNTIYALGVDSYGRVWCCMNGGVCQVVENEQAAAEFTSDQFFDEAEAYCITAGAQGEIYLGTSGNEMAKLTFKDDKLEISSLEVTYFDTGDVFTHNQIRESEDGTILISGLRGFGLLGADGSFVEFGENRKAASVNASALDYEGNIWLASTTLGIVKYSKGCFETPNEAAALEGKALNTIVRLGKEYYAGADDGLLAFDENWAPVQNDLTELLATDRIRNLLVTGDGTLWAATYYGHGAVNYNPKTEEITCYGLDEGLAGEGIRVLFERSDGSVAVGTQSGISIIQDGKVVKNYAQGSGGLDNGTILCFAEDENGTLYAGTDGGGIYTVKDDEITNYGFAEGLNEGVVLRMLQDKSRNGWFISAGSSLYYFQDGNFKKLENFEKSAGSIFDLYEKDGTLYMMQNNGILTADIEALLGEEEAQTVLYGFSYGLTGSLNANTWNYMDENGILYLVTRSGISTFGFSVVHNPQPAGIISEIRVDEENYVHPEEITINSGATRITIDFATLSYTGTTTSGMSYQLEGFDAQETEIRDEKSSSISYTNLPGGDYRFCLRVYDLSDPKMSYDYYVDIHKEKKITESPAFWILCAVLLVAVLALISYLIARAKIRSIRKRQKEYQTIVDQFLRAFAKAIDAKDQYTNGHSIRVALYSRELARRMNMSKEDQERVYYIALMHDIGKIGIPDSILKKADKLTKEEMDVVKTHPMIGGEILKDCTALEGISEGAQYHHERYDGTGYCQGLKGKEIPQIARIIGVADAYDTMANERCYRKALEKDVIISELTKGSGSQFDPEIVPIMLQMMEEGCVPVDLNGKNALKIENE
ncbi:MAG: HD domain-containing protein [Lachnospiraceae bacterium]|nr:HD domain-containing protein [Lachnospiraceae bacterium]